MGVYYQTEYRLGRRGGVVCRTYTGPRAYLAIAFDLFFLLTFEFVLALVVLVMRNFCAIAGTMLTAIFYLLSVPFRVARWIASKLERVSRCRARPLGTPAAFCQTRMDGWSGNLIQAISFCRLAHEPVDCRSARPDDGDVR